MAITCNKGFTLIEVLVAVFLTSVISVSVFSLFISVRNNFHQMILVSDMQHNTMAALENISGSLKYAGCDPFRIIFSESYPPFKNAFKDKIHFEMDVTGAGGVPDGNISGTKESIIFSLYDSGGDGDLDLGRKKESGRNTAVAENIEKIGFYYFNKDMELMNSPVDRNMISSVFIAVLGRTAKKVKDYRNTREYNINLPDGKKVLFFKAEDSYKRYLLSCLVKISNR